MKKVPSIKVINSRPNTSVLIQPLYDEEYGLGSGGTITGFNRLDLWSDYTILKKKWVLSAYLGWDLHTRINALADKINGGGTLPGEGGGIDDMDIENIINDLNERLDVSARNWQDVMETMRALQAIVDDLGDGTFTEPIKPITLQTMLLIVGDESLQFRFVKSKTDTRVDDFDLSYSHIKKKVSTSKATTLQHMTLGIKDLKPNQEGNDYKFWDIYEYESEALVDDKLYYLEAKCNKDGSGIGSFITTEMIHKMDEGDGYYYFLVGIINQVRNGSRSFAPLYGFTEILPGRITVDKIVSADGKTYFDLSKGEIGGNIVIGSSGTDDDGTSYLSKLLILTDLINARVLLRDFNAATQTLTDQMALLSIKANLIESTVSNTVTQRLVDDAIEASTIMTQWAVDTMGPWHYPMEVGDIYYQLKKGSDANWGPPIKAVAKDGTAIKMKAAVNTYEDLALLVLNENEPGDGRITNDLGVLWVWDGGRWNNAGKILGPAGRSGRIYRAYADILYDKILNQTATEIGFSGNPFGKSYLGIQITFDEAASTFPKDYEWMKIVGPPGRGIAKVEKQYYVHTSKTVAPDVESLIWSKNYPTFNPDAFLWMRDKITYDTYVDGKNYSYTEPVYNSDWEIINIAMNNANEALIAASSANSAVTDLMTDLDAAIKDGVVDATEIGSLTAYVNILLTEKEAVEAEYLELYKDPLLLNELGNPTPMKTALKTAYEGATGTGGFKAQVNRLIGLVNNAITNYDPANTKALIDAEYILYRTAYTLLIKTIEAARHFIVGGSLADAKKFTQTQITQLANSIDISAVRSNIDALGIEVLEAKAAIKVTPENIMSYVQADDLVSIISQDANSINALAGAINLKANLLTFLAKKSEFDALGNLVDGYESRISATEEGITLSVKKGETLSESGLIIDDTAVANIESRITISPDMIELTAENIKLEGLVTANDNFKILSDGSMETRNAHISGYFETSAERKNKIVIDPSKSSFALINSEDFKGVEISWGTADLPEISIRNTVYLSRRLSLSSEAILLTGDLNRSIHITPDTINMYRSGGVAFRVKVLNDALEVHMSGLPTSIPSGANKLYTSDGYLKIS